MTLRHFLTLFDIIYHSFTKYYMINRFLKAFHRDKSRPQPSLITKFKKVVFYTFITFTGTLIISKIYKTNLTFMFLPTQSNKKIIKQVNVLEKGVYQPSLYLYFSILHRIYSKYIQAPPYMRLQQEEYLGQKYYWIPLHHKDTKNPDTNIAVIIGGSQGMDNTMKNIMLCTYRHHLRTVGIVLDDVHDTHKLHQIVQHIKQKYQGKKIYGVGIQYGANLLVRYAVQYPNQIGGLVSIGNPLDIALAEQKIQKSYIWRYILYKHILKGRLKNHPEVPSNTSLYQLDQHIYNIPSDQLAQWKHNHSSINYIHKLNISALFIQSNSDPFCINISEDDRIQNQKCVYVETNGGGHNEWFQSNNLTRWVTRPVSQYLRYLNVQH